MDPLPYLSQAHPVMKVSSGSAYPLGATTVTAEAVAGREFGLLSGLPPSSSSQYSVFLGEQLVGSVSGRKYSTPDEVASVEPIVKTRRVYSDNSLLEVAYQVRDAAGRSQVLLTGLSVKLTLTLGDGSSVTSTCGSEAEAADADSGIGRLRDLGERSAWFSHRSGEVPVAVAQVHAVSYGSRIVPRRRRLQWTSPWS